MMRRVVGSRLFRFHFPKRGRIRFFLSLIAIAVIIRVAVGLFKNDNAGSIRKNSSHATASNNDPQDNYSPWNWNGKNDRPFLVADVSKLLESHPPRLTCDKDTIRIGKDSLVLFYSIDTSLQRYLSKLLNQYHPKYGGIVVMDPVSGRILSMLSYTLDGERDLGKNLFCRSIFPAASIFKTVTAAAALEKNALNPQSALPQVGRKHTLYKFQLAKDLRYFNEIPFEDAYAESINPVFARIGIYIVGTAGLKEYIRKFGFNMPVPFELENDRCFVPPIIDSAYSIGELASGFNTHTTISPLFGACMAGAVCEDGREMAPRLVDSIRISNRDTCLYTAHRSLWQSPIKASTAEELRFMMEKVTRNGTARKSFKLLRQTALFNTLQYGGKTGTVDMDSVGKVDWFIGFSRDPFNKQKRITAGIVTAHGENWTVHSSYLAAEAFRTYMKKCAAEEKVLLSQSKQKNTDKPAPVSGSSLPVQSGESSQAQKVAAQR
jgi:penicillin-binding protein A